MTKFGTEKEKHIETEANIHVGFTMLSMNPSIGIPIIFRNSSQLFPCCHMPVSVVRLSVSRCNTTYLFCGGFLTLYVHQICRAENIWRTPHRNLVGLGLSDEEGKHTTSGIVSICQNTVEEISSTNPISILLTLNFYKTQAACSPQQS